MDFEREIFAYKRYFLDFYESLNDKVQRKIEWTLNLIRLTKQVPEKYFKHIEGTKGLYEIRVEYGSNIFRIFAFFDSGNLVILGNGFQKKTQKTPKQEIEKALKIKMEYENENKNLTNFTTLLDKKYGKRGAKKREQWEQEFEAFKLGVLIQEMREKKNMTQAQLAAKCGTTKSYISRIENNASDIRLSTLMRIVTKGLDGHLKLSLAS